MQHAPISRTRFVQENRKMRFQEAYEGWSEGRLTQVGRALKQLGIEHIAAFGCQRKLPTLTTVLTDIKLKQNDHKDKTLV